MPALPNANQVLAVLLYGPAQNKNWLVRQHIAYTGSRPAVADLTTLANTIKTGWGTYWAPVHVAGNNLTNVQLTDLTDASGATSVSTGAAIVGTRAGVALSVNVAAVTSWKINRRYRGGHPRTYWPAGAIADIIGGYQWSGTFIGAMNTAGSGWLTFLNGLSMNGGTLKMINLSYYSGTDPVTHKPILRQVPVQDLIVSSICHGRVDSMRRRTGKELP